LENAVKCVHIICSYAAVCYTVRNIVSRCLRCTMLYAGQVTEFTVYCITLNKIVTFNDHGSVHRKNIPIYIQQYATLHSFIISANYLTYFGWYLHPSSGAHKTVSTASGICHTVTATCRYSGRWQ